MNYERLLKLLELEDDWDSEDDSFESAVNVKAEKESPTDLRGGTSAEQGKEKREKSPASLPGYTQVQVNPKHASEVDLKAVQNVGPLLDALHLADARNSVSARLSMRTPRRYGERRIRHEGREEEVSRYHP